MTPMISCSVGVRLQNCHQYQSERHLTAIMMQSCTKTTHTHAALQRKVYSYLTYRRFDQSYKKYKINSK